MYPIRTGIIGFGLSGRVFQAPFLDVSPRFEISKIYSSRKSEINSLYKQVEVVGDVNDILSDPQIDLAIVASPNTEHFALTKKALLNGKHVVVEKPFVTEIKHGEELIGLARQQGKVLSVFQNRRWDGDFQTVKEIIGSGQLGSISEYEVHFDRFRPEPDYSNWRSHALPGSGVFFDLGPHLIDQAIDLFGMPEAVFGDIRVARSEGNVDDTFEVILFYKHHRAKLKAGVLVKELGPHFIVHGSNGSFVKYGLDPQEELLKKGAVPKGNDWGTDDESLYGTLNIVKDGRDHISRIKTHKGNYMGFFDNVADAISENKPLAVKPETALQNIRVILAAIESSKQRKVLTL
ncbi:MAG: Gfo/Idh/MocA family oxidoreductase [Bacteroidales bacterium]|nr:Gfo/Idh/MocA family oxidoreductase [Bacteroidales bacterium]